MLDRIECESWTTSTPRDHKPNTQLHRRQGPSRLAAAVARTAATGSQTDPRDSRAAVTPHMYTACDYYRGRQPPTPTPPPRHRRSQRPAQFARAAVTSCDYYRGLLLRCCAPPSSSTCSPSSYTPLLLGSAFVQYVDRTCFGASLPDMLPLGPESFGVLIGPSSSLFNIG